METTIADMTVAVLEAYKYSEADLAKELGCSQPTVNRIKIGVIKNPGYATGAKIQSLFEQRPNSDAAA